MSERLPLRRISTVEAIADSLRTRILDRDLRPGERLRELDLAEAYGVARHTLRSALRALAGEGLVTIAPNRGATVARLTAAEAGPLFELRTALEVEAARLALERHGGELPASVDEAVRRMGAVCLRRGPRWSDVVHAHDEVHRALVAASHSPRIVRAYESLAGELRLFVIGLEPSWPVERMAEHHERLLAELATEGVGALRRHLAEGAASLAAPPR